MKQRKPPFALGDWIVEPELHQLTLGDLTSTLEPRVMSVLLELAAHPHQVVAKEDFLKAVWPDTFVGEDALTRCISVLRHVLKDDPHHPRFVKTIPKVGYCLLIATRSIEPTPAVIPPVVLPLIPLQVQPPASPAPPQPLPPQPLPPQPLAAPPPPEPASLHTVLACGPPVRPGDALLRPIPWRFVSLVGLAMLFVAGAALSLVASRGHERRPQRASIATSHVTVDAGDASRPALSPDGRRMAFVWAPQDSEHSHIFLKQIGSDSQERLTQFDDDEYSPVWSPDGKYIAFLSSSASGLALYVTPADAPRDLRKLYIPSARTRWENGALTWAPDGSYFILADHLGSAPNSSLFRLDKQTLLAHPLTTPPSGWEGDLSPAFSPDGTKIAFLRASENAVLDLYWIDAAGGEAHRVTHDGSMINGIAWSSNSRSILFSSNRAGEYALWRVAPEGDAPERLPIGSEESTQPSISADGKELAFVHESALFGILRLNAAHAGPRATIPTPKDTMIVSSSAQDSAPNVSPDGQSFAFQSWRSESQQIWISSIDGLQLRRLTPGAGKLSGSGSPAWSPAGNQIAFDSRIGGHSHIFIMPAGAGAPRQLTFADANDIVPRWSLDGRSLYFRSNRGGRWQLWKLSAAGGTPQPITHDDGMVGQESPDGKWLYFTRGGENGIWRMPVAGGDELRVLDLPIAGYWAYWAVTRSGIYFLDTRQATPQISLYDPSHQTTSRFARLSRMPPLYAGLTMLPNGRGLLISDIQNAGTHILLAQGPF